MLIVCPNCATSYMLEPASVGPGGRTVRCARCKTAWFATPPQEPAVAAFVENVIAEAQAESSDDASAENPPPPQASAPDDFAEQPPADEVAEFAAALDENRGEPGPEPDPAFDVFSTPAAFSEEPVALAESPSLVPPIEPEPMPPPADPDETNIESFAARRERRAAMRQKSRKSQRLPMIIIALICFNAVLITWRADVVRMLPQTASLYAAIGLPVNLRGLSFEDVKITKETHDGVDVLVVEGSILASSRKPVEVPRLRFAVRNAAGLEIYSWTMQPTRSILGAGEAMAFRSRLASPPPGANDVLVRFFHRRDILAGAK
ncbi:MAG: MJ0042-type zinc finger domain-containing protein [Hyphomicrobiales bacterium]